MVRNLYLTRKRWWLPLGLLLSAAVVWGLTDETGRALFANTAWLAIGAAAISLPLGIFLAVLVSRTDLPMRRPVRMLLAVLLLLPLYLVTAAWQAGFGPQGGATWWSNPQNPWVDGPVGAIWVHAMAAVPWVVLIVGVGLRLVEPELEEDALTTASALRVFFRVTLPRSAGAIGVAVMWVMVVAAGEMTVTDLVGMRTYAEVVYTAFAASGDVSQASLQILPGVMLTVLLVLAVLGGCVVFVPQTVRRRPRRVHLFRLGRWRWPIFLVVLGILFVIAGIPLASLAYEAGVYVEQTPAGWERSWSATKMLNMATLEMFDANSGVLFVQEIGSSLWVALIASTGAILVATFLAWWASRSRATMAVVFGIAAFCLAVPGPFIGKGVIELLGPFPAIYDSALAPALAQSVRALALPTLILWFAFRSLPRHMLEEASLAGASSFTQLWRIALPQRMAALGVAYLVAWLVCVGDLSASQLVLVPGGETLANRIFDRLHSGAYDQVSGVCLAMIFAFSISAALLLSLLRRWSRENR